MAQNCVVLAECSLPGSSAVVVGKWEAVEGLTWNPGI